jgi:cation diffusion facilitator CzcD-associated flavoprotein CzcO
VEQTDVVIIGAGPHGLAAAAHLRRAGVECLVHGRPMSFWRESMPKGMLLRSNRTATCIAEYDGPLSLDGFHTATGTEVSMPFPLEDFVEYGTWVQAQVAPDVDERTVVRVQRAGRGFLLTRDDDTVVRARRVVVAAGIADFTNRPEIAAGLPSRLASHTADHVDLGRFAGRSVLVVGGGQSALESAALLHEAGAEVSVAARASSLNWLHGGKYHRMLGRLAPLVYAPTDVGPMGLSRIVAVPDLFRRFPRRVQDPMAYRAIRPAGAAWLRPRLVDVPIETGRRVRAARPSRNRLRVEYDDGRTHTVDHMLFGTGYRVDVARYPFLDDDLVRQVKRAGGYPLLRPGMESSVRGLHFLGAPAAHSFGPIMRFVAGGWYGARSLTRGVTRHDRQPRGARMPKSVGEMSWS